VSPFVLDSSLALSWCFGDETSESSDALLGSLETGAAYVPAVLWELEIGNALLVATRRGRLSEEAVGTNRDFLLQLPLEPVPPPLPEAFELATAHRLSSYDATYLALARALAVPLASLDRTLLRAAEQAGVACLGS